MMNQAVHGAIGGAMYRAVGRAIGWAMYQDVNFTVHQNLYHAMDGDVALAVYGEPPQLGLARYLAKVG